MHFRALTAIQSFCHSNKIAASRALAQAGALFPFDSNGSLSRSAAGRLFLPAVFSPIAAGGILFADSPLCTRNVSPTAHFSHQPEKWAKAPAGGKSL